jgi:hypothetical protein
MRVSLNQVAVQEHWEASVSGVQHTSHQVCYDEVFKPSDPRDMFCQPHQQCASLDDLRVMTPDFEEDAEMAAARDVVTADLKCLHDANIPSACSPSPQLQSGSRVHPSPFYMNQEASGAAGSSYGASSPQASCDTAAAKAQQVWAAQQYDAAFSLVLAHSPDQYPAAPMHGAYGSSSSGYCMPGAPCSGPRCYPGQQLHPQASSSSLGTAAPGPHSDYAYAYAAQHSAQAVLSYAGLYSTPEAPFMPELTGPAAGGMVPHAAFGHSSSGMALNSSAPPAGISSGLTSLQRPQRGLGSYPSVQGGVQKKSAAAGVAVRRSTDGSCSSQDASPMALPHPKKSGKAATAAAAAGSGSAGRSRGCASAAGSVTAAIAASGSAASLIKELQQKVCGVAEFTALTIFQASCTV